MQPFKIPSPGDKPLVICEIALAHDGSLGNSIAYIRACAAAGADAVKFQDHLLDQNNDWRNGVEHPQDVWREDYWKRTGFKRKWWGWLREIAHAHGVWFGVTPFSEAAYSRTVNQCDFIKIPRNPVRDVSVEDTERDGIVVIHTGDGGLGLDTYDPANHIGISCHAPGIAPALDAVRRGALIVEKHICWDRRQFGPDTEFSITIDELGELCESLAS